MYFYATIKLPADSIQEADVLAAKLADDEWPLIEVSSRFISTTANEALKAAERERIALADAWRSQMEGQGVPKITAALIVQDVIDNAHNKD